jgi:type IV secretion system protein VirD4
LAKIVKALGNMLRVAARDPLKTLLVLLFNPLTAGGFLVKILLITGAIFFILYDVIELAISPLHLDHNFPVQLAIDAFVILLALALFWRQLTDPLLQHFGENSSDTHGTARFASPQEVATSMHGTDVLLIGRDTKTRKLLRYNGRSHLLTIAPTRTFSMSSQQSATCPPSNGQWD